jgi:hypothetical protein
MQDGGKVELDFSVWLLRVIWRQQVAPKLRRVVVKTAVRVSTALGTSDLESVLGLCYVSLLRTAA